jgi:2-succinyl-5-enolpyruvyl-6-hydroxy-3-cyclohexene-1-carboxylate synthase
VTKSERIAAEVVAELLERGVREAVLCPGSRSAPLALALAQAEQQGSLRLHVRIDERGAGFLALGLAKATEAPTAVVTTSGTAVGNLLPAVMEAYHARVPLVVVTADRPEGWAEKRANQTTWQSGIFGRFTEPGEHIGPAHLNVHLGEPLVEVEDD